MCSLQDVLCGAKAETNILRNRLQRREPPCLKAEVVARRGSEKANRPGKNECQTHPQRKETPMIYKRGKVYWYKFMWQGKLVRESSKQGNDRVARNMESAHRTSLAKGEVGIRDKKPVLSLVQFIDERFEPWAKATFGKSSPKTWLDWYRVGLRAIKGFKPLADSTLSEITGEMVAEFAAYRQAKGLQVSTVNSSLRVLRRALRLAVEWGAVEAAPKIKLLSGERHRERVVSRVEEAKYLAAAPEPVGSIAAVLCDTGMRPEECFRLSWEAITWVNGRHGTLLVTHGKTAAARRVLPMTPRVRNVLETRWEALRGLGVGCADSQRSCRVFEPQETARQDL
jgi:hypothetical protein